MPINWRACMLTSSNSVQFGHSIVRMAKSWALCSEKMLFWHEASPWPWVEVVGQRSTSIKLCFVTTFCTFLHYVHVTKCSMLGFDLLSASKALGYIAYSWICFSYVYMFFSNQGICMVSLLQRSTTIHLFCAAIQTVSVARILVSSPQALYAETLVPLLINNKITDGTCWKA